MLGVENMIEFLLKIDNKRYLAFFDFKNRANKRNRDEKYNIDIKINNLKRREGWWRMGCGEQKEENSIIK
jgi:hypothetical protein